MQGESGTIIPAEYGRAGNSTGAIVFPLDPRRSPPYHYHMKNELSARATIIIAIVVATLFGGLLVAQAAADTQAIHHTGK